MENGDTVLLGVAGRRPETPATVALTSDGYAVHPRIPLEGSRQLSSGQSGTHTVITVSGHPADTVHDYLPRTLWGEDERGMPFTFLDAKMRVDSPLEHRYTGWLVLYGAHVIDREVPTSGVRLSFPLLEQPGWISQAPTQNDVGEVSAWADDGRVGVQWRPLAHRALSRVAVRDPEPFRALLSLWTDKPVGASAIEVELPGHGWKPIHNFRARAQEPTMSHLLPMSRLTLDVLAQWIGLASRLGPLPYMALSPTRVQQPDAHNVAAGLEGLHRRVVSNRTRLDAGGKFEGVDKQLLGRARKAAVDAAMRILEDSAQRPEDARSVFDGALSRLHEPSYKERMMELLPVVNNVAPGLLGPDLKTWVRDMETIRNIQAHQLTKHDDFGEEEISLYYVLEASGRWAMRIILLLEVATAEDMSSALRRSSRFAYSLANIDREQHWSDFSAIDTFWSRSAETSARRPDNSGSI